MAHLRNTPFLILESIFLIREVLSFDGISLNTAFAPDLYSRSVKRLSLLSAYLVPSNSATHK